MEVKGNHPLAEIIAKKLFGISSVPKAEQDKMINRACKEAVEYYDNMCNIYKAHIKASEQDIIKHKLGGE